MTTFSEQAKQAATDFFKRFDYNGDGTLQKKQLFDALHAFGCDLDKEGIEFAQKHFDVDGDGDVQIEELVDNLDVLIKFSVDGEKLEDAFKKLDTNGDGFISSRELMGVLTAPGPNVMTQEDASKLVIELVRKFDADGDKKFTYMEFVRMLIGSEGDGTSKELDSIVYH